MPNYGVSSKNTLDKDAAAAFRQGFAGGSVDPMTDEEKKKKEEEDAAANMPTASQYLSSTGKRASSYLSK